MIKINGLKEPPKWYRYVEPGEEPDPRALRLQDKHWSPRSLGSQDDPYSNEVIYAVPIYGPIPDGYEATEEWAVGLMYWSGSSSEYLPSGYSSGYYMDNSLFYIRPIKPTPAERPLLTAADFMKDGPWWVRDVQTKSVYLVVGIHSDCITTGRCAVTYAHLRDDDCERSNDGEHWEDC